MFCDIHDIHLIALSASILAPLGTTEWTSTDSRKMVVVGQLVDLYEVLEVDRKVTGALLRKNFRRLALQFHPDCNGKLF